MSIADILAGGAFTRQQAEALMRLLDLAGGASDHASLSGLDQDDHPHYLTDARADALFAPVAHTHPDAWKFITLPVAFDYSAGTAEQEIPGLEFIVAAGKMYEFDFRAAWSCTTTAANSGPAMSVAWPAGATEGMAMASVGTGNNGTLRGAGVGSTIGGHGLSANVANTPYAVALSGFVTGGGADNSLKLTVRTMLSGAHVLTIRAGALLRYREVP